MLHMHANIIKNYLPWGNENSMSMVRRRRTGAMAGLSAGLASAFRSYKTARNLKRKWDNRTISNKRRKLGSDSIQRGPSKTDIAGGAITTQHDIQRYYLKGRSGKGSKLSHRRKRKFTKKVRKAITGEHVVHFYQERHATTRPFGLYGSTWAISPNQGVIGSNNTMDMMLWECGSYNATSYPGQGINQIATEFLNKLDTRWNGTDIAMPNNKLSRVLITHSSLQVSVFEAQGVAQNLDIYEFEAAKDISNLDTKYTPRETWIACLAEGVNFGTTTPSIFDFGNTPLDAPGFGKYWKLLSKSRIFLQAGGSTTFTIKGNTGIWDASKTKNLQAQKGKTKHIMMVNGSTQALGATVATAPMVFVCRKNYHWKQVNDDTLFTTGVRCVSTRTF